MCEPCANLSYAYPPIYMYIYQYIFRNPFFFLLQTLRRKNYKTRLRTTLPWHGVFRKYIFLSTFGCRHLQTLSPTCNARTKRNIYTYIYIHVYMCTRLFFCPHSFLFSMTLRSYSAASYSDHRHNENVCLTFHGSQSSLQGLDDTEDFHKSFGFMRVRPLAAPYSRKRMCMHTAGTR